MKKYVIGLALLLFVGSVQAADDHFMEFWMGAKPLFYDKGAVYGNGYYSYAPLVIGTGYPNPSIGKTNIKQGDFIYASRQAGTSSLGDIDVGDFISVYYNNQGQEIAYISNSLVIPNGVMAMIWIVFQSNNEPYQIYVYPWETYEYCHGITYTSWTGWEPKFTYSGCY